MPKELKYEAAISRLEEIVESMETGQLGLDELNERLKEAQRLIKTCRDKLTKTEEEIKKTLADDSEA